jgi:hypothetical protein
VPGEPLTEPASTLEQRIAGRLRAQLSGTSLLPAGDQYERDRVAALEEGTALLVQLEATPCELVDSRTPWSGLRPLGLETRTLPLVAGLGLCQGRALGAALAGDDRNRRAAEAAGVLNLLTGLFDFACDRRPETGDAFRAALGEGTITRLVLGKCRLGRTGIAAVDSVLEVGQRYIDEVRSLGLPDAARTELVEVLERMLSAELASLDAVRDRVPPDDQTWRVLHDKSALPLWAMAVTAAPYSLPGGPELDLLREAVSTIGELLWIVDDLLDARLDWEAGVWSRPWAIEAERSGEPPPDDPAAALTALLEGPVVEEEARRAAERAAAAVGFSQRHQRSELARSIGLSVESWLRGAEADGPIRAASDIA